jgi:hypothetical protein
MTGLNKFDDKERRRKRRSNHEELDLRYPKKMKHRPKPSYDDDDWKDEL